MNDVERLASVLAEESEIIQPNPASESVRTTIPSGVRKNLELKKGDILVWEWKVVEGQMVMTVRKK